MFYPVESLRRGGRFYLCWVADSWPLRFAAITHRQLWSQDIRKLCDDLLEVMTNESGRPTNRFSLRLSSQLMRGLVRLYERKVTVLLGDLCMISATVFKSTNKKLLPHERPLRRPTQLQPAAVVAEEPEDEQRVEEMIQNSGNVVINIQDITLKEAAIPDFQLPPNDNFGEENPEQHLLSLLGDRTVEMMMHEASALQVSGPPIPQEVGDKADQSSRPALEAPQMELVPDMDVTPFRKSTGEDLLPAFEKDVSEIPEIPPPDLPVPTEPVPPEPQVTEEQDKEVVPEEEEPARVAPPEPPTEAAQEPPRPSDELEELEEQPAPKKRRMKSKLIIDKKIRISSEEFRARIENPNVDIRSEEVYDIRVPSSILLRRPAHGGCKLFMCMSPRLDGMFKARLRELSRERRAEHSEPETEQVRQRTTRASLSALEKIAEVEEQHIEVPPVPPSELEMTRSVTQGPEEPIVDTRNVTSDVLNVTGLDVPNVETQDPNAPMQVDISDLPTQKLETLSQIERKRTSEDERPLKRLRSGYTSFRESQQEKSLQPPEVIVTFADVPGKENIPPNIQDQPTVEQSVPVDHSQIASQMLKEAGISDIQQYPIEIQEQIVEKQVESEARRKDGSDSSETPLGSLDRTKVSLGDSIKTTDSQKFIRAQFGNEGTMRKIIAAVKEGGAVTIERLVGAAPRLAGHRAIMAARCFTSVLKLKQHGFIRIVKDPETLEILDILLGPKFDNL